MGTGIWVLAVFDFAGNVGGLIFLGWVALTVYGKTRPAPAADVEL